MTLNYDVLQDLGCCVSTPEYSVPPLPEQYVCNSIVNDVGSTVYLHTLHVHQGLPS
jgi:hypothetical protein